VVEHVEPVVPFRYVDDVQRGATGGDELRDRTGELLQLESGSGQQHWQVLVFADHFGGSNQFFDTGRGGEQGVGQSDPAQPVGAAVQPLPGQQAGA
jgi:hypothetical protein